MLKIDMGAAVTQEEADWAAKYFRDLADNVRKYAEGGAAVFEGQGPKLTYCGVAPLGPGPVVDDAGVEQQHQQWWMAVPHGVEVRTITAAPACSLWQTVGPANVNEWCVIWQDSINQWRVVRIENYNGHHFAVCEVRNAGVALGNRFFADEEGAVAFLREAFPVVRRLA